MRRQDRGRKAPSKGHSLGRPIPSASTIRNLETLSTIERGQNVHMHQLEEPAVVG